ncbi:ATP:cob(I)alamin adenosyltransferase [Tamilnaduibacter salinus]|uniref:Corrinoid adenosyltransferase n=1 Tax=Tamilnaduibacter salinus TaxID=1484056 RepID=A0A2A2I1T7_9GAMM|nr:cob(I)yrinic acid a,c-diamide adenosyltransferase [Tamilnaduibacter salinus]PAV25095.1 ATP:cob(I)alamin adenosyltransferase [Tamilnaduibacter salinus]PVY69586.1 ATP:cob(I)alamin adenosyltransferase [Tamilnaduibacter salinus]
MGYRLSKIYTRTGDDGSTGLADGSRVAKSSERVDVIGTVDELNCQLGLLIITLKDDDPLVGRLNRIQHHLFDLGGEFAIPGSTVIQEDHIQWLEETLDDWNEDLPPLKNFILPGGSTPAAHAHLARAICRRAERTVVSLSHQDAINPESRNYLNRLSDLLFVAARLLARRDGGQEVLWEPTS